MKGYIFRQLFLFTLLFSVANAAAQIGMDKVAVHGFGGWGFGRTDGNRYIIGNENGEYNYFEFALNLSSNPTEKLSIKAQPFWNYRYGETIVSMDYIFAEWNFSNTLKFRIGKIKSPFGLYSEIIDVGTLRPFFSPPQNMYGAPGFVQKSYSGIGLTGTIYFGGSWDIEYDVYGGQITLEKYINKFDLVANQTTVVEPYAREMAGGRVICHTPINGLSFGFAGISGDVVVKANGEMLEDYFVSGRHYMYTASAEYLSGRWLVRSEYLGLVKEKGDDIKIHCGYFETAFRFTKNWEIAGLYIWQDLVFFLPDVVIPETISSLFDHKEWAIGLNYWFNSNFVLKCSCHMVEGNFYAEPTEDLLKIIMGSDYDTRTNLVMVGAQFSF
jgi:hypothetical protein